MIFIVDLNRFKSLDLNQIRPGTTVNTSHYPAFCSANLHTWIAVGLVRFYRQSELLKQWRLEM